MEWRASAWGRLLTKTEPWRLHVEDDRLFLRIGVNVVEVRSENLPTVEINCGVLWTDITLREGRTFRVDGLPNSKEPLLREEIGRLLTISRRERFQECYSRIQTWLNTVAESVQTANSKCLWLTHEMQQELLAAKPILSLDDLELNKLFQTREVQSSLPDAETTVEQDLEKWMCDWPKAWARRNDDHMLRELEACKALLAGVESKPLTDEQSRTVICFDNRVQVIASAGSGKTSTMVAKAAYAMHRKLVLPSSIVMLAFNKSAAEELQARVALSLERVSIEDVQIEAKTFHSLGLSIIAEATGPQTPYPSMGRGECPGLREAHDHCRRPQRSVRRVQSGVGSVQTGTWARHPGRQ